MSQQANEKPWSERVKEPPQGSSTPYLILGAALAVVFLTLVWTGHILLFVVVAALMAFVALPIALVFGGSDENQNRSSEGS